MPSNPQSPESSGQSLLSIMLMSPDGHHRKAVADALSGLQIASIRALSSYPSSLEDLPHMLEPHCDVIIVDLDSNPEFALKVVETVYANGLATVMVFSAKANLELAVRCMRAGAREFLTLPL